MSSINIGYLISRAYDFLTGASPDSASEAVRGALAAVQVVEWIALALSGLLLVGFVALYFKALRYEHAGWHHREEEEVTALAAISETPRNERFEQAIDLANSAHPADWRRAILEADILLGEMLTERGFPGKDIGEQLKGASRAHFNTLDLAWEAHRVRNGIAHQGETYPLSERETLATIDKYRQVFEEFGYV